MFVTSRLFPGRPQHPVCANNYSVLKILSFFTITLLQNLIPTPIKKTLDTIHIYSWINQIQLNLFKYIKYIKCLNRFMVFCCLVVITNEGDYHSKTIIVYHLSNDILNRQNTQFQTEILRSTFHSAKENKSNTHSHQEEPLYPANHKYNTIK